MEIQKLNYKIQIGKPYLVPCLTRIIKVEHELEWNNDTLDSTRQFSYKKEFVPIINHPHNDIENGQQEVHYHKDDRFESNVPHLRPSRDDFHNLEYLVLICLKTTIESTTPVDLIKKSKLKHRCIHKNKCPHRGFDLSNETKKNGVVTCPLHGLKFNAKTKILITEL